MNDNQDIYIVYCLDKIKGSYEKRYGYKYALKDYADGLKTSLYQVENIDKPFKNISYYKVYDLIKICNKLEIETVNKENGKDKLKKDLYEAIIQYF